ncbi:3'-phosphoadenosine 5'-phosphosulfate sulfotransferase (PAPS reductase)/FAD synthetase [Pasteurella testudinis DSM 23072]|uniref:3'-phosphoadenosine 5'-phosphosulfate sulfotransferase (PAPS reductase)/FAD synthetase n=1 Tax=Pasteurella testudinis DSM 23072 TaxID=1122938 RepID=A0A1W1UJT0_9PAST|nr:phosphoadenosine phosphosulfate reductase family protein [Pasteurella testudinis]SMB81385.1 3'-phosphoadenosine 5'-phosphosulfate sulfotransferase (PAPS reductase)/FAD synthetase [Pasteurella testudinis DSM 23072]SUB51389.1 PUA domain (predicted RNA-binding domain) [Pasteurella testudinis]
MFLESTIQAIHAAKKPLFQLSGGRDSLCALFVLIEQGCRSFDVAYLNTGDAPEETVRCIGDISKLFGARLHVIKSNSFAVRDEFGLPSPMVRSEETAAIWAASTNKPYHIQSKLDCCARTTMIPMMEFVEKSGYDLLIRGCREVEELKTPVNHLEKSGGITLAYPIYDWSDEQVMSFLDARGILPSFYEYANSGIDCVTCPAYWGEGHQAWIEKHHPEKAAERRRQIERLMSYMADTIQLGFNELDCRSPNVK